MQQNNVIVTEWLKAKGVSLVGFADLHGVDAAEKQNMPYGVCLAVCPWTKKYIEKRRAENTPQNFSVSPTI